MIIDYNSSILSTHYKEVEMGLTAREKHNTSWKSYFDWRWKWHALWNPMESSCDLQGPFMYCLKNAPSTHY